MKKILLLLAVLCAPLGIISAQNESAKKVYLPEKGDFAVGINLNPVLKFAGNVFNGSSNNQLEYVGGQSITSGLSAFDGSVYPTVSIMGKYMIKDNFGLRINLGLLVANDKENAYVRDDNAYMLDPMSEKELIDSKVTKQSGMSLMLGTEWRKGNRRVQGVFGAGLMFGFSNRQTNYDYANELTTINQHPTSAQWDNEVWKNDYRVLTRKETNNVFIGVVGSVGVEWFVAPKVALGAEMNLSLYYIDGGQVYYEAEGYNASYQRVESRCELSEPGTNKFRFGTENIGGSLYMAFYF